LPFASTEVEIWAWPGEASASQPLATSTATGMQFVFIMLADLRLLTTTVRDSSHQAWEGRALFREQTSDTHTPEKEASPA
jgi:hypothetical protein